ncbi:MAG: RagB/SusD family nutrient uptake outer membrane protein [Bacteroidetes bacterium]|jgi:starch-binding outer membrane protein, SusD/RagB family|nr:RagB/SusD family nutrient uptake outer membrane protein [Bacteroidota bacterium]
MKRDKILGILIFISSIGISSCTGDLNVTPIDPDLNTADVALTSESDYKSLLAKCYSALAVSSSQGPSGDADIDGIDGGFGQYIRALFYMNELTTDEAVIGWNDATLRDLHGLAWTSSDQFVAAAYYRTLYEVSLCNEFIRQAEKSGITSDNMNYYIAEARALRALAYYHAIDMFGNVPFATEDNSVGATLPEQKSRADMYEWLVTEILDFKDDLKAAGTNDYGRMDQGAAEMILAKLYLNAEIYASKDAYSECATVCKEIATSYSLVDNYPYLFLADNNTTSKGEIIFAVEQDGLYTQSYGCTNFIIFAATGGSMPAASLMGISSGWGGLRTTPEFVDLFDTTNDTRALFYTDGQEKEIADLGTFTDGYAVTKFRNRTSAGAAGQSTGFVDTDFPVFRLADVYLMLAECAKRGATTVTTTEGLTYLNQVRTRAGLSEVDSYTLDDILDERGRELYWECHRRSDLIRFGKFTTSDYLWSWKGHIQAGKAVADKFNLFPIPDDDINANSNLTQNTGY